jgi:outer membrane protein assembly complex protein YaeT
LRHGSFSVSIEKSSFQLKDFILGLNFHGQIPNGSYVMRGSIPLLESGPMKIEATSEIDASILSGFLPQMQAAGSLSVVANAIGPKTNPHFDFSVKSKDLDLQLPEKIRIQQATLELHAEGKRRSQATWRGTAVLTSSRWNLRGVQIMKPPPVRFELSNQLIRMKQIDARIPDLLNATAAGSINTGNGSIDFHMESSGDLADLSRFFPHTTANGHLEASLHIAGNLSSPRTDGRLSVRRAYFQTSIVPYGIENLQMEAVFRDNRLLIEHLSAGAAGGLIRAGGELEMKDGKLFPELWLNASGLGFEYLEDVRGSMNADLRLSMINGTPFLAGRLALAHCIVTRKITPNERANVSSLLARFGLSSSRFRLPFPLIAQIKSSDPLLIDNNLGRIEADVDLQVRANPGGPKILGVIDLRTSSQLFLQTRQFRIQQGKILFDGSEQIIPRLDMVLTSSIPDDRTKQVYQVRLPLRGTIDNLLDVPPTSSPPLLAEQIYFLLLTGRSEGQLTQSEARFMRQQLLAYYSAQKILPVPDMLPANQHLNSVEVSPELISSEKDPGKSLLNGRNYFYGVSLLYSLPVTQPDEQTWIASYRARKNIAIRLIDQTDGSYSSNIQQTFRFGGRPSSGYQASAHSPRRLPIQNVKSDKAGLPAMMEFNGYQPDSKSIEKYVQWWREGFNDNATVGIINEDILRELWTKDYHSARITVSENQRNNQRQYKFEIKPGPKFAKVTLHWNGIRQFDPVDLRRELIDLAGSEKQLQSKALHEFVWLQEAIAIAYAEKGFYDVVTEEGPVHFDPFTQTLTKGIFVSEGQRSLIAALRASENQELPDDLIAQLKQKPGEIYKPEEVARDELTIARFYESRGFRNVRVKGSVVRTNDALILNYELKTGDIARIANIDIIGTQFVNHQTVERVLPFKSGDVLVQDQIGQAQKRLADLGLFHDVRVQAIETGLPDRYNVEIRVQEAPRYEITYSAGYNTEKKAEGRFQFINRNVLSKGGSLSFVSKLNAEDTVARLLYDVPDLSGWRWQTLLGASYEELEQPLFRTLNKSLEAQRQLQLSDAFALMIGYRFDRVRVTEKDPTDLQYAGESPVNLSRLETTLLADSRNDSISPVKGWLLSVHAAVGPAFLGSGQPFVKNYSQFYRYQPLGKMVWASGLRLGFGSAFGEDLIATERFFSGGSFSLRGFEKDSLGPRDSSTQQPIGGEAVLVINEELRFPLPLHEWLGAAIFYDAGNVYNHVRDFIPLHLRHSAGLGLRFNTPLGVARFDWGFNLNRKDKEKRSLFHIAFGQAF